MKDFCWPDRFPSMEDMKDIIKKTVSISWKNDITNADITEWLNNFTGEVYSEEIEQRLALWMLCNFTYYNEHEVSYLCRIVYKLFLHDIAVSYDVFQAHDLTALLNKAYFAAIGRASESGNMLLYHFRQVAHLSLDQFYFPSNLPKNEDGIAVFVDDVTLSGTTASRFIKSNLSNATYSRIYYLTLFASDEAEAIISDNKVKLISSTHLNDRDRCFSDASIMFSGFHSIQECAMTIAKHYGEKINSSDPLGYKNGQYSFGLYYNTPNNTLPIFWSNNNWKPIFNRKEKLYNVNRRKDEFDSFI